MLCVIPIKLRKPAIDECSALDKVNIDMLPGIVVINERFYARVRIEFSMGRMVERLSNPKSLEISCNFSEASIRFIYFIY